MGLHVHMLGAEDLLRPFDRQRLHCIGKLAPAIVAAIGVSFRILVGEDRALRFEHGLAHIILGRDENDLGKLAFFFSFDRVVYIDVCGFEF
jgi:hypothetical protein